jgi:hypothetical protein
MTNTLHAWSRNTRANPIQKVFCDIKSVLLFSLIITFLSNQVKTNNCKCSAYLRPSNGYRCKVQAISQIYLVYVHVRVRLSNKKCSSLMFWVIQSYYKHMDMIEQLIYKWSITLSSWLSSLIFYFSSPITMCWITQNILLIDEHWILDECRIID